MLILRSLYIFICIEDTESVVCPPNGKGKKRAERRRVWTYWLHGDRLVRPPFHRSVSNQLAHCPLCVCPLYNSWTTKCFFSTIKIRFSPSKNFRVVIGFIVFARRFWWHGHGKYGRIYVRTRFSLMIIKIKS